MILYHTSPNEITTINRFGLFDDCLFFSNDVYQMSACDVIVYSIDASEMSFAHVSDLYDAHIIDDIAENFGIDSVLAEALLDDRSSVWDYAFASGEAVWYIQAKRGECAKAMGFDGCEDRDEQGTVYIIPMLGRENILERV